MGDNRKDLSKSNVKLKIPENFKDISHTYLNIKANSRNPDDSQTILQAIKEANALMKCKEDKEEKFFNFKTEVELKEKSFGSTYYEFYIRDIELLGSQYAENSSE